MRPRMRGLIRKSVIFFENIDSQSSPVIQLCDPACDGGVRPFGILADGRPIRLGGHAPRLAKVCDFLREHGLQLPAMVRPSDQPAIIEFGHFSILPHRRQLLAEGRPIRLGGRAFDLLLALIEAPGVVVGKDELLSQIWPGRIVEENRLQSEISGLRKALGAGRDLIQTVAGRGYQFTAEIRVRSEVEPEKSATVTAAAEPPRAAESDRASSPLPDKPSIAVLPFANMSGDPEREYFADGMVEEIITALSRIRWLFVTARNSTFRTRSLPASPGSSSPPCRRRKLHVRPVAPRPTLPLTISIYALMQWSGPHGKSRKRSICWSTRSRAIRTTALLSPGPRCAATGSA